MKSISHFLHNLKNKIHIITGTKPSVCPICASMMRPHGRCRRFLRISGEKRIILSIRVFFCVQCHRYHRELPDFIVPYKHLCTKMISQMNEETNDYAVDNSTIIRIRHWLQVILKFGEATIRRLTLEHPTFVTEYNAFSTFAKLRYFVKVIMNANEWKFSGLPVTSNAFML